MAPRVVVGAAIVDRRGPLPRALAAQRSSPPALAGLWEFPGGKVEPGEDEPAALRRECREELGVGVVVGERLGDDLAIAPDLVLRVWTATTDEEPQAREHRAVRWLAVDELDEIPWIPVDAPLVDALRALLRAGADAGT